MAASRYIPSYFFLSPSNLYLIGGLVYLSTNSGVSWTTTTAPRNDWSSVASSSDGVKLVAASFTGVIYVSGDSGATWTGVNAPNVPQNLTVASSADGSKLVAVNMFTSDGGVLGGNIYTLQFPLPPLPAPRLSMNPLSQGPAVSWLVPSIRYVLQENLDLNSRNWTEVPAPPTLDFTNLHYDLTVSPSASRAFYRLEQR